MTRAAAFLFSLSIIVPTIPADCTEGQGPTRAEVEAMMGLPSDGDRVRGQMDTNDLPNMVQRVHAALFELLIISVGLIRQG